MCAFLHGVHVFFPSVHSSLLCWRILQLPFLQQSIIRKWVWDCLSHLVTFIVKWLRHFLFRNKFPALHNLFKKTHWSSLAICFSISIIGIPWAKLRCCQLQLEENNHNFSDCQGRSRKLLALFPVSSTSPFLVAPGSLMANQHVTFHMGQRTHPRKSWVFQAFFVWCNSSPREKATRCGGLDSACVSQLPGFATWLSWAPAWPSHLPSLNLCFPICKKWKRIAARFAFKI